MSKKPEASKPTLPDMSYRDALQSKTEAMIKRVEENTGRMKKQQLLQISLDQAVEKARKSNAILYELAKCSDKPVLDHLKKFMSSECFSQPDSPAIISVFRLGAVLKKKDRPIKIKFKDEDKKWDFLKSVTHHFKNTKSIFCLLDRPKQVCDEEYKLRQAAKSLCSEHLSEKFRTRNQNVQIRKNSGGMRKPEERPIRRMDHSQTKPVTYHCLKLLLTNCRSAKGNSTELSAL